MVHSDAILNDVLEKIKSKDANWCILALFETMFCKLETLRKCLKQGS